MYCNFVQTGCVVIVFGLDVLSFCSDQMCCNFVQIRCVVGLFRLSHILCNMALHVLFTVQIYSCIFHSNELGPVHVQMFHSGSDV